MAVVAGFEGVPQAYAVMPLVAQGVAMGEFAPEPSIEVERQRRDTPILVCLLGSFRLLKRGQPLVMKSGGKFEALLSTLGIHHQNPHSREALLSQLWPESDADLAGQSLNSLVYSLHKLLGDVIGGAAPILFRDGYYSLNFDAGVGVDVALFDSLVTTSDSLFRAGCPDAAAEVCRQAVDLYKGDLRAGTDVQGIVERERLRVLYLNLLARLADYHFAQADYSAALANAQRLLINEPCREDAHRLVMRCYMRRGERAQALRQFRLCEQVLRAEFDASPEPSTTALFDLIRINPAAA